MPDTKEVEAVSTKANKRIPVPLDRPGRRRQLKPDI